MSAAAALEQQAGRLVELGVADLLGMSDGQLRRAAAELGCRLPASGTSPLLVADVSALRSMPLVRLGDPAGKPGFVSADIADLDRFTPIDGVDVPGPLYALLDVQRGDEYSNWSPDEALPAITARGRTPLTVAEGVGLALQFPHTVERNHCFMLLASRCDDRRVPALWISGGTGKDGRDRKDAPKIGWCWAGNRHTWLGHASAAARIG